MNVFHILNQPGFNSTRYWHPPILVFLKLPFAAIAAISKDLISRFFGLGFL